MASPTIPMNRPASGIDGYTARVMIDPTRLRVLNDNPSREAGRYVLYWMQQSQRVRYNHALACAIEKANALGKPVVVCFGLMDDYPEANERHYAFLLEGLRDVEMELAAMGIAFVVRHGPPDTTALALGRHACAIVCDRGYLRHQIAWRDRVADEAEVEVTEVETDVVVPVETVSNKHEFAARTIRPKIHRSWNQYLVPMRMARPRVAASERAIDVDGARIVVSDPVAALGRLKLDRSVKPSSYFRGGSVQAQRRLEQFINDRLPHYDQARNEPADAATSHLSMYLHFGQISPLDIALRVAGASGVPANDRDKFIEELIVRRELSMNFVHFEPRYDQYDCLPEWARKTLSEHRNDPRQTIYTRDQLERAETGDPYWNAAQMEMVLTGFMHNYMRMYWGKCILGWTRSPQEAFDITLALNNKYELDGRDANSFANVAWVFGIHDRPWGPERKVFGTVRYMNAGGLKRKFDIDRYVRKIDAISREIRGKGLDGALQGS